SPAPGGRSRRVRPLGAAPHPALHRRGPKILAAPANHARSAHRVRVISQQLDTVDLADQAVGMERTPRPDRGRNGRLRARKITSRSTMKLHADPKACDRAHAVVVVHHAIGNRASARACRARTTTNVVLYSATNPVMRRQVCATAN